MGLKMNLRAEMADTSRKNVTMFDFNGSNRHIKDGSANKAFTKNDIIFGEVPNFHLAGFLGNEVLLAWRNTNRSIRMIK